MKSIPQVRHSRKLSRWQRREVGNTSYKATPFIPSVDLQLSEMIDSVAVRRLNKWQQNKKRFHSR